MIVSVWWCEAAMTLFHHLKLKRPRMNSAEYTAPTSPSSWKKSSSLGNGNKKDKTTTEAELGSELLKEAKRDETLTGPSFLESVGGALTLEDSEAMPQLERQNSVFDGGGGDDQDVPPPQLWPPANAFQFVQVEEGGSEDTPPPPLLMGDVLGRGKTMVWTKGSPAIAPARSRAPPSSTITSPSSKGTSSPKRSPALPTSPTAQQFESAQALLAICRTGSTPLRPTCSRSSFESADEDSTIYNPSWVPSSPGSNKSSTTTSSSVSPDTQALNLCVASTSRGNSKGGGLLGDDDGQPMVCMICEDRATGLHYGIITCEGCKGFFKRTVQNKRVYTCVADGNCEVTKAQRNRCQYCRFQKCVRQGMVLAAVREDRMPGGRNSGAVYNLYKVKYKKHRRGQKNGHLSQDTQQQQQSSTPLLALTQQAQNQEWANGQILKAALTSPAQLRHNYVSGSGRASNMSFEQASAMIHLLMEVDAFEEVAKLRNAKEILLKKAEKSDDGKEDGLNEKLCRIGDNIVYKLVQWTKRLPFYHELPKIIHTQLLTHKWHELLVLTSCAFLAIRGSPPLSVSQLSATTLCSLKESLTVMVGEPVALEELEEAGPLVDRLARLADTFRRMALCMEEYVCLKVIIMESSDEIKNEKLEAIHDRYMKALQVFVEQKFTAQATRFSELLNCIPEITATANLVVQSKMFYVPVFLNTSLKNET